ncbi:MAG: sugar phosphate isomerase/epimerase [Acidobacteria bacterium]|nr:sugar phosphate isomerase/epimerase [Acidobacteriota bacterium]
MHNMDRREFVKAAGTAALGLTGWNAAVGAGGRFSGPLCIFSKHFPELGWADLAATAKGLGFDGIDLTVRKGGHVAPERVAADLPLAAAEIRKAGLSIPMITTEVLSATPVAREVFSTAGRLSIPFLKPGYYRYKFADVRHELEEAGKQFAELAALAQQSGIRIGYHNHADYVGAPIWDMARILDRLDARWAGYYFDICHAVAEGGGACWKIAFNLAAPRIFMIAVKDFFWERTVTGGWRRRMCPLGQGMVDWPAYFKLLAQANYQGPISLHVEYEIPGTTAGERQKKTIAAVERDFGFLKAGIREAYV